jgi:hypothetical protein
MVLGGQALASEHGRTMGKYLPRTRAGRRTCAAVAGVIAAVVTITALASPAVAASEATFTGMVPGASATVVGSAGGGSQSLTAGLMAMTIDGAPGGAGYCIDIHTNISDGAGGLPEVDWATSGQDAQPLVATAIVLLATGTLLGILARRRRDG